MVVFFKKNLTALGIKHVLFLIICCVYGFFSTSSPDKVGVPEAIIGLLLALLVGIKIFFGLLDFMGRGGAPKWLKIIVFSHIIFPTAWGLIFKGNNFLDYIRDVVPLLYMFLPILLYCDIRGNPKIWLYVVVYGLFISGLGITFQYYMDPAIVVENIGVDQLMGSNLDNPWQEPSAVFAFCFSVSMSIYMLYKSKYIFAVMFMFVYAAMSGMYFSTVSRAPIGLSIFSAIFTLYFILLNNSNRSKVKFVMTLLFIFSLICNYIDFNGLEMSFEMLKDKTKYVGFANSRDIEMIAVLNNAGGNYATFVFGEGWGGLLSNPIGGGANWRFVHNSFFFYFLKSGCVGLILYSFYILWCFRVYIVFFIKLKKNDFIAFLSVLSSVGPLVIAVFLEPMFKALTFGMVLMLLVSFAMQVNMQSESINSERFS